MNDSFIPTAIGWLLALAVFIFVIVVIVRSIRIIPQATAGVVERCHAVTVWRWPRRG